MSVCERSETTNNSSRYIPGEIKGIIEGLSSEEATIRIEAAFHLTQFGEQATPVIPYLIEILDDHALVMWPALGKKTSPAEQAFEALVNTGQSAVMPLTAALGSQDPVVRESTAKVLGRLRDKRATEFLIRALMNEKSNFERNVEERLAKMRENPKIAEMVAKTSDLERHVRENSSFVHLRVAVAIIMSLGMIQDCRALGALEAALALDDPDWVVRDEITRAMARLGECSVEPLVAALKSGSPKVRANAAEALGCIKDLRTVKPLIAATADDDLNVRRKAVRALGSTRDRRAIGPLLEALRSPDIKLREEAEWGLRWLGETALEPVKDALRDKDSDIRVRAVQILGSTKHASAVKPLITALKDADKEVRNRATQFLGEIKDVRAIGPLIGALEDQENVVRRNAALSLTKIGRPAVSSLIVAMKDKNPLVRCNAACALGFMGDPRGTEWLIGALYDGSSCVRDGAAWALGQITHDSSVKKLVVALRDRITSRRITNFQGQCMTKKLEGVVSHLLDLHDANSGIRERAAQALGKAQFPCAVNPLVGILGDTDPGVRRTAAQSLAKIGNPAIPSLIAAIMDESLAVRNCATWALEEITDICVHRRLIAALQYEDPRIRRVVALVLGRRQRKARDNEVVVFELTSALEDPDVEVRRNAAWSLGRVRRGSRSGVIQPLIAMLKDENLSVRRTAIRSLVRFGQLPLVPLIKALKDKDPDVRGSAAWALGKIGARYSVVPLIATLKDEHPAVRRQVVEALGKMGDYRVVAPLINALQDEETSVQEKAARALWCLKDSRGLDFIINGVKDETSSFGVKELMLAVPGDPVTAIALVSPPRPHNS